MKKELFLHIAEPCHENWEAMDTVEKGRFCMSCSKKVIDFSNLSDQQILGILSKAKENTCGRFSETQLQRPMIEQSSIVVKPYKFLISALIPAFLLSNAASAQIIKGKIKTNATLAPVKELVMGKIAYAPIRESKIPGNMITGTIVNDEGYPIPYASVYTSELKIGASCDSFGNFRLELPSSRDIILSASSAGYLPLKRHIKDNEPRQGVVLQLAKVELPPVSVVSYPSTSCSTFVGGLSVVRKVTFIDTLKTMTARLTGTQMFNVYPNPVSPGADIFLTFKKAGAYSIQLFNNAGGLFVTKELVILSTKEPARLTMPGILTAGIYYLKATGKKEGKSYTGKLVVE